MKNESRDATSPLELAAKLKEIAGNLAMEGFARHDAGVLCEAADFLENTHGILNAWKRDYEGEKARGDAWMADCKAADARIAELSKPSETAPVESRSLLRRIAAQKGEPAPDFSTPSATVTPDCVCSTFKTGNGYCPVHGHSATR